MSFNPSEYEVDVADEGRVETDISSRSAGKYVLRVVAFNAISGLEFFCRCATDYTTMVRMSLEQEGGSAWEAIPT